MLARWQVQVLSSSVGSGRRLCFALRPAGRATSSGLARDIGWPGGAPGLRILSNTGRACCLDFRGELLLTITQPPLCLSGSAVMLAPAETECQLYYEKQRARDDFRPLAP